jgi:hypothetical protein
MGSYVIIREVVDSLSDLVQIMRLAYETQSNFGRYATATIINFSSHLAFFSPKISSLWYTLSPKTIDWAGLQ